MLTKAQEAKNLRTIARKEMKLRVVRSMKEAREEANAMVREFEIAAEKELIASTRAGMDFGA